MSLKPGVCYEAIVLITTIDEDGNCCFRDIVLLHFGHFPAILIDCIDQGPKNVNAVLICCYFGAKIRIEVKEKDVLVASIEQEVFHHQESYDDIWFGPLQKSWAK